MRRILLTGATGQVGWELQRALLPLGDVIATGRRQADLAHPDSIRTAVRELRPDVIINAAAYTAVDKAESEPELAMTVNGVAPGVLAEEARRARALLVHYSTDYVFDGAQPRPYSETDAPNPINVYGRTKLAGENAVRQVGAPHLIFRISWVYGARGKNFFLTVQRLAADRDELPIVGDQIGAPTWSRAIAEATVAVLDRGGIWRDDKVDPQGASAEIQGTYHLSAAGATSWHGFAQAILSAASPGTARQARLTSIPSEEHQAPAARPKNSLLSNEKLARVFGLVLPDWQTQLRRCFDDMNGVPS
jgi:dTDP-4-dehydrorhamnose reductase